MDLIWHPHDSLRNRSYPLTLEQIKTEAFRQIVSRMFLIMYKFGGVGLAAPQIGLNVNLIVANPNGRPNHDSSAIVLINPEINTLENYGVSSYEEGCLSIPGIYAPVVRPNKIKATSIDVDGNEIEFELDGFLSRIIQHEYDHLNGILFIDRLEDEVRKSIETSLVGHVRRVELVRKKREKARRKAEAKSKAKRKKR